MLMVKPDRITDGDEFLAIANALLPGLSDAQEFYDAVDISRLLRAVRERMNLVTQWPGQPVSTRGETERILIDYGG